MKSSGGSFKYFFPKLGNFTKALRGFASRLRKVYGAEQKPLGLFDFRTLVYKETTVMFRRLSLTFLALTIFGVAGQQAAASFTFINDAAITTAITNNQFGTFSAVSSNGFNLTVDNDTNLQWLDVSVTRGLTRAQVTSLIGSGPLQGFRYATAQELRVFFAKSSVFEGEITPVLNAIALTNIWGGWYQSGTNLNYGYGFYLLDAGQSAVMEFFRNTPQIPNAFVAISNGWEVSDPQDTDVRWQGSALVRTSAVIPEPSGVLLFAIGSCLLPSLRLRQRQG